MTQPGRISPSTALALAARVLRTEAAAIGRRLLVRADRLALQVMQARRITSLPVVDAERRPRGVLHSHDLWPTERW